MARLLKRPWHEIFAECISPHTDAPDSFVTWGALSLIGAALKNNVFFEIGTYTLYPNMFIVLVAPPGIGKGTVMNIVEDMNNDNKLNKVVNTINDRVTAEKIIETIAEGWSSPPKMVGSQLVLGAKEHNCLMFSTEIRTLLGASDWMLEFLEEAWSKKTFDYQTKNKGSIFIDNMCVSLLAASVPDFLRNVNREAHMVITGGFSSRCLFIYADTTSKDLPFPEPLKKNAKSKALWDNLAADLKAIAALRGEFRIAADAKILLSKYLTANKTLMENADSESEVNFRARVKSHIIKLAISLSVSKGDTLVIDQFDIANAINEIDKIITTMRKLFRGAGDSVDATATARVQDFIEKRGAVTKKEILKALYRHMTDSDLDRILWILESIGFVTRTERNRRTYYAYTNATTTRKGTP